MAYMTLSNGELLWSVFWNLPLSLGRVHRVRQSEGFSASLLGALLGTVEDWLDVARYSTGGFCTCQIRSEMDPLD